MAQAHTLVGKPASGPLESEEERCGVGVIEVASPVGVIFGLIPMTSPVSTIVFKTLVALKGHNALIFSCHRGASWVGNRTGEVIRSILRAHGAPVDLVQWIRQRSSRKKTEMFMRHRDVSLILATGGVSMVKAAYNSGTPTIGVGPENAPAWVCAGADPDEAARLAVGSKSFDYGVVCGSEHQLLVDAAVRELFLAALQTYGARVLTPEEVAHFTERAFDAKTGHLQRKFVGQSAQQIARATGMKQQELLPRLIVAPVTRDAIEGPYGREKLAPVLSLFTVDGEEEGHTLLAHPQLFSRSHGAYPYIRTAILASSEAQHICRPFAERRGSGTLKSMSVWNHLTFAFLQFFEVRNAQATPETHCSDDIPTRHI